MSAFKEGNRIWAGVKPDFGDLLPSKYIKTKKRSHLDGGFLVLDMERLLGGTSSGGRLRW